MTDTTNHPNPADSTGPKNGPALALVHNADASPAPEAAANPAATDPLADGAPPAIDEFSLPDNVLRLPAADGTPATGPIFGAAPTTYKSLPSPIVCVVVNMATSQTVSVTPFESEPAMRSFAARTRAEVPPTHLVIEHPPARDELMEELAALHIESLRKAADTGAEGTPSGFDRKNLPSEGNNDHDWS